VSARTQIHRYPASSVGVAVEGFEHDRAAGRVATGISSTWQRPTTRRPGRTVPRNRQPIMPGVLPGRRVALRDVEEMIRTRPRHRASRGLRHL